MLGLLLELLLVLAAPRALARPGWLDLDALGVLARSDLLELAVLNNLARPTWPNLSANDEPNA